MKNLEKVKKELSNIRDLKDLLEWSNNIVFEQWYPGFDEEMGIVDQSKVVYEFYLSGEPIEIEVEVDDIIRIVEKITDTITMEGNEEDECVVWTGSEFMNYYPEGERIYGSQYWEGTIVHPPSFEKVDYEEMIDVSHGHIKDEIHKESGKKITFAELLSIKGLDSKWNKIVSDLVSEVGFDNATEIVMSI